MKSYCLRYRKDTENINLRVSNTSYAKTMILSELQYVVAKNQDLLKIKKQKDY